MSDPQAKAVVSSRIVLIVKRVVVLFLVAAAFTWVLNHSGTRSTPGDAPAGFAKGMLHGALMPGALPRLLIGGDVTIYAEFNTGRTYKLGYTVGVNGCGAIFFGIFFWRFTQWRKRIKAEAMGKAVGSGQ